MLDFSQVKQLFIPQGEVTKITNLEGITLWQKISRILKEWRGLSPLTCTPTVDDVFEEVKVYGNSVQNPIKSRNLLDKNNLINGYYSNTGVLTGSTQDTYKTYDKFPVNPSTAYTFSSNATSSTGYNWRICFWNEQKEFIKRSTQVINENSVTITTDGTYYLSVSPEKEGWEYDLQLEEGDTATPFVPYIIDTPTPDTPIPIESVGDKSKNLFNENDEGIVYGRNISASGTESSSSISSSTYYIKVKPNTDYIIEFISIFGGSVTRYHLYDENKTWLQQVKTNTAGAPGSIETVNFTTTSDTQYLRFTMRGTSASQIKDGKIQLEEGNTATSYEPYGYKVPVEVEAKNYWKLKSRTSGGVTIDVKEDGTVYASGTGTTNIYLSEPLRKVGEYSDTMSIKGNEVTVVRNVEVIDETGTKTIEESLIHKIPSTTETYTIDTPINALDNTSIITVDTQTPPSEIYASEWVEE